jgi:uncharacterized protein
VLTMMSEPSSRVTLRVRCPGWAAGPVAFELNGRRLEVAGTPGTYAAVARAWKKGDRLAVTIPMAVRTEALPDNPDKVAFLFGPLVLAADLGPVPESATFPYSAEPIANLAARPVAVPIIVRNDAPIASSVARSADGSLAFRTDGTGRPHDVTLVPFWEISYSRYNVYWDVVTDAQWMYRSAIDSPAK